MCKFYKIGAISKTGAAFGQGTDVIFLDYVRCSGMEKRLFDCANTGLEVLSTSCSHQKDAGVVCVEGYY